MHRTRAATMLRDITLVGSPRFQRGIAEFQQPQLRHKPVAGLCVCSENRGRVWTLEYEYNCFAYG
jgi:hypothetical protein